MGHANLKNLSMFFLKTLHERNKLSIKGATELAVEEKLYVIASEGNYYDDYIISQAFSEIVDDLLEYRHDCGMEVNPVIEPVSLSEDQGKVLEIWKEVGEFGEDDEIKKFEGIEWQYTASWRDRHTEVVGLNSVSH